MCSAAVDGYLVYGPLRNLLGDYARGAHCENCALRFAFMHCSRFRKSCFYDVEQPHMCGRTEIITFMRVAF